MDLDVEIFVVEARMGALKQRIIDQQNFVKRCQQKQRSTDWKTQGLIPASTYDSLAVQRGTYKKKPGRRRKTDKWHNFFCWADPKMFPDTIIKHAEERIKELEVKLGQLKEQADE